MKKGALIIIVFFSTSIVLAQDFNIPFTMPGISNHFSLKRLRDSSFVSLLTLKHLSKVTELYDSAECLLSRYNTRGEMMYYTKIVMPPGYSMALLAMTVSGDKIFIAGYIIDNITEEGPAFVMRLNECFEVEKYRYFKYQFESNAYFNGLFSFSDTSILVTGNYFIQSDTSFLTVFSMDHDFKILWQNTVMGELSDIIVAGENYHLWGSGYYPTSYKPDLVELKLNHNRLDMKGRVQSQFVKDEHVDGAISIGRRIVKPLNSKFMIANEGRKSSGKLFNGLQKIGMDGSLIKSIQLNDNNNEESCAGLCRINDNRYLAIGVWQIDFYNAVCMAYLVDSNLNIIRKKRILLNVKLVELCEYYGPEPFNDGALLYGRIYDSMPGKVPYGLLYKIDTFLNVMPKPSLAGYTDSLCLAPVSGQICVLPKADTVWLEKLNLRTNIKLEIEGPVVNNNNIIVSPNPGNGDFKIGFDRPESGNIFIYNTLGQSVSQQEFNNKGQIDVHIVDRSSSIYYIEIRTEQYTTVKKVIVVK